MFSSGLILGRHECLCATSQILHLTRIILFTVNYCLFANGDVSIAFNGKDDNVMLNRIMIIIIPCDCKTNGLKCIKIASTALEDDYTFLGSK